MNYDYLFIKSEVDREMYLSIQKQVSDSKKSDNLCMIVLTPGGDPMYAYRSMLYLRKKYNKIKYIVLDMAMSAGTLMALGSDEICLSDGACLGPLDLQLSHPSDESRISTLDIRDTAKNTVIEASMVMYEIFIKGVKSGISKKLAMDAAVRTATELYNPIMDKIDPFHLHESYRNAELSTEYGARLLMSGMIKDKTTALSISSHLTNDYSYHGYAIIDSEARELGLKMGDIAKLDKRVEIEEFYNNINGATVILLNDFKKGEKHE